MDKGTVFNYGSLLKSHQVQEFFAAYFVYLQRTPDSLTHEVKPEFRKKHFTS
jgi:hypothetical protein